MASQRRIVLKPTFQRGYIPDVVDGFRFTVTVVAANLMPTKIFRYLAVPTQVRSNPAGPPDIIESRGAYDGVCSPADLEDFPEDAPTPDARPPWYRLDYVDLIVRSRSIATDAYMVLLDEIQSLVATLDLMDDQEDAPQIIIGAPLVEVQDARCGR
jgi:hypothetical protein